MCWNFGLAIALVVKFKVRNMQHKAELSLLEFGGLGDYYHWLVCEWATLTSV